MTKLEDKIKDSIKNKKPRSEGYFLFQNTARELVIGILWLLCVGLLGALVYLMQNFPWRIFILPHFFLRGLIGLPWELLTLASLLVVALYFLTKNVSTFYRNKNVLLVVLVISLFAGYLIAESSGLNEIIARTRPIKPLYQQHGRLIAPERFPATVGEITSVSDDQISLSDERGKIWTVLIDKNTRVSGPLTAGKRMIIIGKKDNDQIKAQEIGNFMGKRGFGNGRTPPGPLPMY